jgi:uncharacterized protein YgiM (DUF1202 family)
MKALLDSKLSFSLMALLISTLAQAAEPIMTIKSVQTTKALTVFSEPGKTSSDIPVIQPEQFSTMVNLPVLQESGSYVKVRLADGKQVWILSEKVRLDRAAKCGTITPADVVTTVKRETNAPRGIGEACAKGGK